MKLKSLGHRIENYIRTPDWINDSINDKIGLESIGARLRNLCIFERRSDLFESTRFWQKMKSECFITLTLTKILLCLLIQYHYVMVVFDWSFDG